MKTLFARSALSGAARAAAVLGLLASAAPAAAEQARTVLSVTAIVAPACRVAQRPGAGSDVSCSHDTGYRAVTAAGPHERPLEDAAAILGAPVRRDRGIAFTAPVRTSAAAAPEWAGDAVAYHTVTY